MSRHGNGAYRPPPREIGTLEEFMAAVKDTITEMDAADTIISIVPESWDIKYVVELGISVMLSKPLIVVLREGRECPVKLRAIADVVFVLQSDPDSDEGRSELSEMLGQLQQGQ